MKRPPKLVLQVEVTDIFPSSSLLTIFFTIFALGWGHHRYWQGETIPGCYRGCRGCPTPLGCQFSACSRVCHPLSDPIVLWVVGSSHPHVLRVCRQFLED